MQYEHQKWWPKEEVINFQKGVGQEGKDLIAEEVCSAEPLRIICKVFARQTRWSRETFEAQSKS